uniref:Uncharacterized protein n=1 Tax=Octopus bimaculoides TaxID=37653 RepID=A0A0L8GR35_OCTBM
MWTMLLMIAYCVHMCIKQHAFVDNQQVGWCIYFAIDSFQVCECACAHMYVEMKNAQMS